MTILSDNLKKLREHRHFSKEFVGRYCQTTASSVSQWENPESAYVPKVDKLLQLAGLYKTTIEELMTNPKLVPGEIVSPVLDNKILEKVFRTIENSEIIRHTYETARIKRRAYLFTLIYSLCEEIDSNYLDETEVTALMDLTNDPEKTKTAGRAGKLTPTRTRSKSKKGH